MINRVIVRYALICASTSALNLLIQWGCTAGAGLGVSLSLLIGTAGALVPKYVLDRNLVFAGHGADLSTDTGRFFLYASLGAAMTLLFWAIELGLVAAWDDPAAQYVGGAVGLLVTHALKYQLDRRFVFKK